jgi:hypothetical protein
LNPLKRGKKNLWRPASNSPFGHADKAANSGST